MLYVLSFLLVISHHHKFFWGVPAAFGSVEGCRSITTIITTYRLLCTQFSACKPYSCAYFLCLSSLLLLAFFSTSFCRVVPVTEPERPGMGVIGGINSGSRVSGRVCRGVSFVGIGTLRAGCVVVLVGRVRDKGQRVITWSVLGDYGIKNAWLT